MSGALTPLGCDFSIGRFTVAQMLERPERPPRMTMQYPDGTVELGCKISPRWRLNPMGRFACHNHLVALIDKIVDQSGALVVRVSRFDPECTLCDIDRHECPGCGEPTPHVARERRSACAACRAREEIDGG